MTDHFVIHADELLFELERATPCQDCSGRLGLFVDLTDLEAWQVIQVHDVPCAATNNPPAPEASAA